MKLSVVVPCYNEEEAVGLFYNEAIKFVKECNCTYEIVFVNDGSKDNTVGECLNLKKQDKNISVVNFSRNFGKEAAMLAGLTVAKGDYVVLMDADLQDPPSLLPEMLKTVESGEYDCVGTRRVDRAGEPPIRSFFARMFYKIINKMIDVEIVDGARDYRLMNRKMVNSILSLTEYNRFSKGIFAWVGYKTKYIEFENVERVAGETKWSFWKLFKYAIEGIIAFTTVPLRVSTYIGILSIVFSVIWLIVSLARKTFIDTNVLVFLITLMGGFVLLAIGILGEYLAKTYTEVKCRPVYIIKEIL